MMIFNGERFWNRVFLMLSLFLTVCTVPAFAHDEGEASPEIPAGATEQATPPPALRGAMGDYLSHLAYDPERSGPLLVVAPPTDYLLESPLAPAGEKQPALATISRAFGRRIVNVGRLTFLAPREMTILFTNPGTPRLSEGMTEWDAFPFLLGSLTPDQWGKACGDGIIRSDLQEEQQFYFDKMLPDELHLQKSIVESVENLAPNGTSVQWRSEGDPIPANKSQLRLRLFWKTRLGVRAANGSFSVNSPLDEKKTGQAVWSRSYVHPIRPIATRPQPSLFGLPISAVTTNRLKNSDLLYASAALDRPVVLSEKMKTVGDLLAEISAALRWEMRADKRVAALPLYLRILPGESERAGDLLEGLAWSVSGAYRRLGERTFLLTYDREGIGTKLARLNRWAGEAYRERERQKGKMQTQATKRLSLTPLRFRPRDPQALPDDVLQNLQAKWRRGETFQGVELKREDLSPDLRQAVEFAEKQWSESKNPVRLHAQKVELNVQMEGEWTMPDGNGIEGVNAPSLDSSLLARFLNGGKPPVPPASPTTPAPAPPTPSPTLGMKRRILIFSPEKPADAAAIIAEAKRRGFTEIWVRRTLKNTDTDALAPLNAAIAAGKKAGMPVAALVPLLKETGFGEEDRTILGETGTDVVAVLHRQNQPRGLETPDEAATQGWLQWIETIFSGNRGWIAPSPETNAEIVRRITRIAETPGLAGLALTNAAPPGYLNAATPFTSDPGLPSMGYLPPTRLAFLRAEGIDPADMPLPNLSIGTDVYLPFFPAENSPQQIVLVSEESDTVQPPVVSTPASWNAFRDAQSRQLLAQVYAAVRKTRPKLPLYQDDRYTEPIGGWPYFASFDAPNQVQTRLLSSFDTAAKAKAARAVSETILFGFNCHPFPMPNENRKGMIQRFAAEVLTSSESESKNWDGFTADLTQMPPEEILQFLALLPK